MEKAFTLLVLALSIGSASFMVTTAKISQPVRVWVVRKGLAGKREGNGAFWRWLGELLACPFCTATWLAFGAVTIYRPWAVQVPSLGSATWVARPVDFLVTSFALTALAMPVVWAIKHALAPVGAPAELPSARVNRESMERLAQRRRVPDTDGDPTLIGRRPPSPREVWESEPRPEPIDEYARRLRESGEPPQPQGAPDATMVDGHPAIRRQLHFPENRPPEPNPTDETTVMPRTNGDPAS